MSLIHMITGLAARYAASVRAPRNATPPDYPFYTGRGSVMTLLKRRAPVLLALAAVFLLLVIPWIVQAQGQTPDENAQESLPTGLPTISGIPVVDQTLAVDTSAISDEDGLTNVSYSYQWIAGESDINGATNSDYTLGSVDVGKAIKVKVTFNDDANNVETRTSEATALVVSKPNVLVILVDDLGYNDVSYNGATQIQTTNIDRLANRGIKFTNGYVTYPTCTPSRAGLLTGRYPSRFGLEGNLTYAPFDDNHGLPIEETLFPESLQDGGYRTGIVGKWQLGAAPKFNPLNRGFDYFFGFLVFSQLGIGICLRKGSIELSCLVGSC